MASIRRLAAAAVSCWLAGCGYHLRGSEPASALPANITTASVSAPTEMRNALYVALQSRGLSVSEDAKDADVIVRSSTPKFVRRLLSVDDRSGDAREYELLLDVRYTVDRAGSTRLIEDGRALVQRDILEDTSAIIGKRTEEEVQRREMKRDAAEQIVERIAVRLAES